MKLTIGHLYPDLLNLYGDGGNVRCLVERLAWRGIEGEVKRLVCGEHVDFSGLDIVLLGGGPDREQELVCRYLQGVEKGLRDYVETGGVVLAVCGGYQMLGQYYQTSRRRIEGLGILDIYTEWEPERLTGNIVLKSPLFSEPVVGFENHGGRTYIGYHEAFGRTILGYGNSKEAGCEGVICKNVIGTYLHGPLLPKNPQVCDLLIQRAIERRYGENVRLKALPDVLERRANRYMVRRLMLRKVGESLKNPGRIKTACIMGARVI